MTDANPLPTGGPSESGRGGGRLALPDTLNGQLLLLAYDRRRNRVDGAGMRDTREIPRSWS